MNRRQFVLSSVALGYGARFSSALADDKQDILSHLNVDWRLPRDTVLEIWPTKLAMDLSRTLLAVADWSIPSSSRLVIRLEDGSHELRTSATPGNVDGERLFIIGNARQPDRCRLTCSTPNDLFYVPSGKQIGLIDGLLIEHTNFDSRGLGSAFLADNGGLIRCGSNIIVRNFYYGFQARYGGVIECAGTRTQNSGDANYFAFNGGHISARGATAEGARDSANNLGSGFVAEYGGTINAVGAIARYNEFWGFVALSNGVIRAYDSLAEQNGRAGYYSNTGGVIVAHRGTARHNCSKGVEIGDKTNGFEGSQFIDENNPVDKRSCKH